MGAYCTSILCVKGSKEDMAEFKKRAKDTREYPDRTSWEMEQRKQIAAEIKKQFPNSTKEKFEKLLKEIWDDPNEEMKKAVFSFLPFLPKEEVLMSNYMHSSREIIEEREDMIVYSFLSKWGPSNELVRKVSKLYPDLHFEVKYSTPEFYCQGICEIKNGETLKHIEEEFEFGICPFCRKEITTSLGKYCPECHKKLDRLIINNITRECITYGTCTVCKKYIDIDSNGQCRDCNHGKRS